LNPGGLGLAVDRQHAGFRENLGAVSTWSNSVGYQDLELPTTFSYYWINRAGEIYGTDDPSAQPDPATGDWTPMRRKPDPARP